VTTFYELRNRDGELVAIHVRRDLAEGGKQVSWMRPGGERGLNGTPLEALPLYGIHRLAEWSSSEPIVLTEGEKSADALTCAGILAVGTTGGAAVTPSAETLADLAGRTVILWPDNDEPGRRHMDAIADRLEEMATVGVVNWPDAPPKGDAADFMAAGATSDGVRSLLATAKSPHAVAWRTLADIDDTPPAPLLLDMLEPSGPTLLYAAPGVGKGMTGAYLACRALDAGLTPMIFDAEGRPREWARRVSGLGGDRSRVIYVEPHELGTAAGKPLWQAVDELRRVTSAAGVDLLIVDSIVPAVGVGEERLRSDARVPFEYVGALDSLGIPSISFGHPPKGTPEGDPFGSMAWIAAMRLVWLGTRAEGNLGHLVRWRPRKRNERGQIPAFLLTFAYGDDGRLSGVERQDDELNTRRWLLSALREHESRTVAELAEELLADEDEYVTSDKLERTKDMLKRTLNRMARQGAAERDGKTGAQTRWRL
jgi:AAA domain